MNQQQQDQQLKEWRKKMQSKREETESQRNSEKPEREITKEVRTILDQTLEPDFSDKKHQVLKGITDTLKKPQISKVGIIIRQLMLQLATFKSELKVVERKLQDTELHQAEANDLDSRKTKINELIKGTESFINRIINKLQLKKIRQDTIVDEINLLLKSVADKLKEVKNLKAQAEANCMSLAQRKGNLRKEHRKERLLILRYISEDVDLEEIEQRTGCKFRKNILTRRRDQSSFQTSIELNENKCIKTGWRWGTIREGLNIREGDPLIYKWPYTPIMVTRIDHAIHLQRLTLERINKSIKELEESIEELEARKKNWKEIVVLIEPNPDTPEEPNPDTPEEPNPDTPEEPNPEQKEANEGPTSSETPTSPDSDPELSLKEKRKAKKKEIFEFVSKYSPSFVTKSENLEIIFEPNSSDTILDQIILQGNIPSDEWPSGMKIIVVYIYKGCEVDLSSIPVAKDAKLNIYSEKIVSLQGIPSEVRDIGIFGKSGIKDLMHLPDDKNVTIVSDNIESLKTDAKHIRSLSLRNIIKSKLKDNALFALSEKRVKIKELNTQDQEFQIPKKLKVSKIAIRKENKATILSAVDNGHRDKLTISGQDITNKIDEIAYIDNLIKERQEKAVSPAETQSKPPVETSTNTTEVEQGDIDNLL